MPIPEFLVNNGMKCAALLRASQSTLSINIHIWATYVKCMECLTLYSKSLAHLAVEPPERLCLFEFLKYTLFASSFLSRSIGAFWKKRIENCKLCASKQVFSCQYESVWASSLQSFQVGPRLPLTGRFLTRELHYVSNQRDHSCLRKILTASQKWKPMEGLPNKTMGGHKRSQKKSTISHLPPRGQINMRYHMKTAPWVPISLQ